jgi:cytochrome oxidase assembly protein ShyY1
MYFTWHRMPDEEFAVYHRFKPYFLIGQLDQSKEVLIPRNKTFEGKETAGFDIINPLYCYEGGKISFKNAFNKEDPVKVERAAIIVNRGWIPARYRDIRSRPAENTRELTKLIGVWRKGKNVHDYKVPNNPDSNEWNNLCLEDIGIFWDLPNFDECKFYYFQCTDIDIGS